MPGSTGYVANALNQYTSVGGAALSYDGNGNLAGDGVCSYRYDPQNRLVSAAKTAGGVVNIAYGYDALGRRRSRVQGAAATRFLWAGEQEIAEYNAAGALAWRFVPGPGLDEPIAALTPAPGVTRRFNHADALGSVVAVSIAAGNVDRKLAYTVYGVADDNSGPAMRYTGRRLDATTGLGV